MLLKLTDYTKLSYVSEQNFYYYLIEWLKMEDSLTALSVFWINIGHISVHREKYSHNKLVIVLDFSKLSAAEVDDYINFDNYEFQLRAYNPFGSYIMVNIVKEWTLNLHTYVKRVYESANIFTKKSEAIEFVKRHSSNASVLYEDLANSLDLEAFLAKLYEDFKNESVMTNLSYLREIKRMHLDKTLKEEVFLDEIKKINQQKQQFLDMIRDGTI